MEPGETLDLSNKKLKKLDKPSPLEAQTTTTLLVDHNELQRLDNLDSYSKLLKFSANHNQLLRMYGVCRLHSLQVLDLSYNKIMSIEGIKELVNLKRLCLQGNCVKTIEHLTTNTNLEYLDLSENSISNIKDLSYLKNLKELFLHKNEINHLGQCEKYLPVSLTTLTLSHNNVKDLNEISRLVNLVALKKISISHNPCVNMTGNNIGFDYRPFVINWCLNVATIDDYVVDPIESLRAEWLYSQGRGRTFRVGEQEQLVQYLASVCPLTGETLETEEDRKLRLILSKAQHHQQQLRDQQSTDLPIPSPLARKKLPHRQSPRLNSNSRLNKIKSPDPMTSSCSTLTNENDDSSLMSQSFDPNLLRQNMLKSSGEPVNSPLQALSKMVPVPESLMSPDYKPSLATTLTQNNNISTTTKNNKITTKIASPKLTSNIARSRALNADIRKIKSPIPLKKEILHRPPVETNNKKTSILRKSQSSEEESEICDSKLQTINLRAEEKRLLQKDVEINSESSNDDKVEQAAVFIQKIWRGYYTRNKNKEVQEMFRTLQSQRANQYIQKLASDMETTKAALDSERKIQMLQTEAISALWKKISVLQPENSESTSSAVNMTNLFGNNTEVVKELAQTCTILQGQIQQLQSSMQDITKVITALGQNAVLHRSCDNGIATQTEIVAVHTPQDDSLRVFPFNKQTRPSSLPLPVQQRKKDASTTSQNSNSDLKEFADSLVDGVIKTVSEEESEDNFAAAV